MKRHPNTAAAIARLTGLGAERLAEVLISASTSAGSSEEWDSETIEIVLSPFDDLLKDAGLPWIGSQDPAAINFWSEIAAEQGWVYDGQIAGEDEEDDDEEGPDEDG